VDEVKEKKGNLLRTPLSYHTLASWREVGEGDGTVGEPEAETVPS
jgi:hypothetical protein